MNSDLSIQHRLEKFELRTLRRWSELSSGRFPEAAPQRFPKGYWRAAYLVDSEDGVDSLRELRELLRRANGSFSGWPPWWIPSRDVLKPYPKDGELECWLADTRAADPAHSDYWRASPKLSLFLMRGFQEDGTDALAPGEYFDLSLPVWRTAEVIIHSVRLSRFSGNPGAQVALKFTWHGLENRQLTAWAHRAREIRDVWRSRTNTIRSYINFQPARIKGPEDVAKLVERLTSDLYESFDLFEPPNDLFAQEVKSMMKGCELLGEGPYHSP